MKRKLIIVQATQSSLKNRAYEIASEQQFACLPPDVELVNVSHASQSGVNAQPIGREEIERGVRNRIMHAAEKYPKADLIVGAESGAVQTDTLWSDTALVTLFRPSDGKEFSEWTTPLPLYDEDVNSDRAPAYTPFLNTIGFNPVLAASQRGFKNTTIGDVLFEELKRRYPNAHYGPEFTPKNPHAMLEMFDPHHPMRCSRIGSLAEALFRLLPLALPRECSFFPARLGKSIVTLPLMTSGDVRLAFFNIRGDWKVADKAITALFPKIPAGIDAFIMPAGKAEGFGAQIARELGVPIVIAVKKDPSKKFVTYAVESTFTSITTKNEQTIALSAADAAKLRGKRVAFVDDVISTRQSERASIDLIQKSGGTHVASIAIFTEGEPHADVIALDCLPIWFFPPSTTEVVAKETPPEVRKTTRARIGDVITSPAFAMTYRIDRENGYTWVGARNACATEGGPDDPSRATALYVVGESEHHTDADYTERAIKISARRLNPDLSYNPDGELIAFLQEVESEFQPNIEVVDVVGEMDRTTTFRWKPKKVMQSK
jgi:adenine phosphoribosyltransferase